MTWQWRFLADLTGPAGSAVQQAILDSLVPVWKANTAYTAGKVVAAPNGDLVSAKVAFTSGATYSAANWNASAQDGRLATLESGQWLKPAMPGTADFNNYTTSGMIPVPTSTGKTNIPVMFNGNLHVDATTTFIVQHYVTVEATPRTYVRRYSGTAWGTWKPESIYCLAPASGVDLDTITSFGKYPISFANHPNQPVAFVGELEVIPMGGTYGQKFTSWESVVQVFHRRYNNGWGPWSNTATGGGVAVNSTKLVGTALSLSGGASENTIASDYGGRLLIDYAVTIPKWRIHVRNYNVRDSIAFPGALNLTGFTIGEAEILSSGPSGRWVSGTTTLLQGAATTPADGSEWVSNWFTTPLSSHKKYMLSYGFTAAAGQEIHRGMGAVWTLAGGSAVTHDPAVYGTRDTQPRLDIWLECEVPASTKVLGVIGDSLSVGHSSTSPVHDSFLAQHCRAVGALPVFWAASGDTLANFVDGAAVKVTRYDGMARPDVLYMALGGNDIFGSNTDLAATQALFHETMKAIRAHMTANIILCSVWPRLDTADASEDVRQAYNDWLETTLPGGAAIYQDTASVLLDPANPRLLNTKWTAAPTNIHLSTAGYSRAAAALTGHVRV